VKRSYKFFLIVLALIDLGNADAQKINSKWYKSTEISNEIAKVQILDAVSTAGYLKFKINVQNNSQKNLLFNPSEFIIRVVDSLYYHKGNSITLKPGERYSNVFNFKKKNWMVDSFYIQNLGMSTESETINTLKVKDMQIPKMETLSDSNIFLKIKTLKRLNKMTFIQFKIEYLQPGNLKCSPLKSKLIVPSGIILSPQKTNPGEFIINENSIGSEFSLLYTCPKTIADLKKDPVTIVWENMFERVITAPVFLDPLKIVLDNELTKLKNR